MEDKIQINQTDSDMMNAKNKSRINAWISSMNYKFIDDIMEKRDIMGMKLSKGLILDLALTSLFISLDSGESLDNIAINHLEREQK